jgi:hypothetical protein
VLRTVLEGITPKLSAVSLCSGSASVAPPAPSVPPLRTRLLPTSAWREPLHRSPVLLAPVVVTPPTESPRDTRGEQGVVLGAKLQLPWLVP